MDPHGPPARVGRDGTLSLRFERRGPATVLAGCRFTLPLQVLAPLALDGPSLVVSMLNPTGSVLGGDHLRIDARAEPGAHAVLTTPSATRVHRTDGPVAVQQVDLAVAPGAVDPVKTPDIASPLASQECASHQAFAFDLSFLCRPARPLELLLAHRSVRFDFVSEFYAPALISEPVAEPS